MACFDPQYSAIAASNRAHAGPCTKAPESQTSDNRGFHFASQLRVFSVYIEHGDRDRWGRSFHGLHGLILNVETTCERRRLVRSAAPVNLKPPECLQPKLGRQIITVLDI